MNQCTIQEHQRQAGRIHYLTRDVANLKKQVSALEAELGKRHTAEMDQLEEQITTLKLELKKANKRIDTLKDHLRRERGRLT